MNRMTFKGLMIALIIAVISCSNLKAQESVNTAAFEAVGSGGSVSASIGQVIYTSVSSSHGILSSGVQQPVITEVVSGLRNQNIKIESKIYPNPTSNELKLEVKGIGSYLYQLFDANGNILKSHIVETSETVIDIRELPAAIYFINVNSKGKVLKSFKVLKQ